MLEYFPKPQALLDLGPITQDLFSILRPWYGLTEQPQFQFDISDIDTEGVHASISDPFCIAAFTLRQLQLVHAWSNPYKFRVPSPQLSNNISLLENQIYMLPEMYSDAIDSVDNALRNKLLNWREGHEREAGQKLCSELSQLRSGIQYNGDQIAAFIEDKVGTDDICIFLPISDNDQA